VLDRKELRGLLAELRRPPPNVLVEVHGAPWVMLQWVLQQQLLRMRYFDNA
jgi:hypothetical protein